MEYQDEVARAQRMSKARFGFSIHLTAYFVVNALLIAINLTTSTKHLWFKWPLLGWGIGVMAHAFVTFAIPKRMGVKRG
jgi:2TM domain